MNEYLAGATSNIETFKILDSASTVGTGKTGLAYNTSSLTCYYKRSNGTASVAVTLASITTLGTFVSGGFKEIDATHLPGLYEFHPPDAAFASGAKWVIFEFVGASGMVETQLKYRLLAVNPDDATAMGIANLDAAVSSRSTYAGGAVASVTGAVGSVTAAIVLPTIPTDWIAAAGVKADAVTKIQSGLSTYAGGDTSGTTTLLTRVTGSVPDAAAISAQVWMDQPFKGTTDGDQIVIWAKNEDGNLIDTSNVTVAGYNSGQSPGEQLINDYNSDPSNKLFVVSGGGVFVTTIGSDALASVVGAIGAVTLATSQPNYAPATATALATLSSTVGTPAQASALASLVTTVGAAGAGLTHVGLVDGNITDAKFTEPTLTTTAIGPVGRMLQLWRSVFKKSVLDTNANTFKTYADDGTTVVTTQTTSSSGGVETRGPAI